VLVMLLLPAATLVCVAVGWAGGAAAAAGIAALQIGYLGGLYARGLAERVSGEVRGGSDADSPASPLQSQLERDV
jgi:hypothetical protein